MSITPGWEEKDFKAYTPGIPVTFNVTETDEAYYIDNGQEFKRVGKDTWRPWVAVCEILKELQP